MGNLANLKPAGVFKHFEEICAIPHGSGNLTAISDYCVQFAQKHGLHWYRDETNNVIIYKDASPGYEGAEPLILQGHLDMVCEKDDGIDFDFQQNGVIPLTDGKTVWAQGTTLGGDDGIAVAIMLTLLEENDLRHPPLEILLTADEETSMAGAFQLDCGMLHGHRMINLDSEDEGILTCSCAGGVDALTAMSVRRDPMTGTLTTVEISGLTGGHSGADIHKGNANANVLMARLLDDLGDKCAFHIAAFDGGTRPNVIPTAAKAVIVLTPENQKEAECQLLKFWDTLKNEYSATDAEMNISVSSTPSSSSALSDVDTKRVIDLLLALPDGVQTMSPDMEGLVQTSTNLAVVRLEGERLEILSSIRSSVESQKNMLLRKIFAVAALAGARTERQGDYPGWRYNPSSALRDVVKAAYQKVSGKPAVIEAIHAGLECGLFADRIDHLDCVSIGPNMKNVHTPSEYLDVASCERFYELLKEVLAMCG